MSVLPIFSRALLLTIVINSLTDQNLPQVMIHTILVYDIHFRNNLNVIWYHWYRWIYEKALCKNTIGTYDCECNTGYTGDGLICTDKDECDTGDNTCDNNAECINRIGGYDCRCLTGFISDDETQKCNDIDECTTGIHFCGAGAECTNLQGSFDCNCKIGYSRWGSTN